ncbi:DUF3951 domain-containing protein [Peribacillus frigoritolerans]|uniref:DUF3951 domain-containing protein n=1 Tax=Peribacillus frigoritolerans TaxID=450367 RepID=UPI002232AECF|nr:DUF3951 domain-containing protein [Peribacillus frigoritolerans]UZD48643.1 hypothetical protein OMJ04_09260 [Peribacillus frigoritolerans]
MVSSLFILIVVGIIGFSVYNMIFKKKTPSNMYTPYDDMIMGKKDDIKRDQPTQDTKHNIEYEEKSDKDKTV